MRAERAIRTALAIALSAATWISGPASLSAAPPAPAAVPSPLPTPAPPTGATGFDDAVQRALELQITINDLDTERVAIDTRLLVLGDRIAAQNDALDLAKKELRTAQSAFDMRAVQMYRFSGYDALAILLDAESWSDLVTRVTMMGSILEADRRALEEAAVVEAQAEYQSTMLDELRSQDTELRLLQTSHMTLLQTAQEEQKQIVSTLASTDLEPLDARKALEAKAHQQWIDSSIPTGTIIHRARATVLPDKSRRYFTSEFNPRRFSGSGIAYSAVCSWYGHEFDGRPSASGRILDSKDFTCASRTLPFGTWLAVTRGVRRVVVVVTDRGPFAPGRDLDLSEAAAQTLGLSGVDAVQVEVVVPEK